MRKLITFIILFLSILITGCTNKNQELKASSEEYYEYFDTAITLKVWDTKEYPTNSSLWQGAEELIQNIQITFQRNDSELARLNASAGSGEVFKCSDDLYEVIKVAMDFAQETDGMLDPTIGPLVDLWDINAHAGEEFPPPTKEEIDSLLPLVDYKKVILNDEEKSVLLPTEGMILELGAISKGFAADKLVKYFKDQGIKHAIINLGGNIYAIGERFEVRDDGTKKWSIGVRDPKQCVSCAIGLVYLKDASVVTSGVYERYIIDPSTKEMYHHILNPDTGYPVNNNLSSVTIIAKSSTTADALSTSVFALGIEDGIKFIEDYPDVEAVFIDKDMKIYKTSGVDSIYHYKNLEE